MIIYDFHVVWAIRCPAEANTPLVVDANRVLAFAVAAERFEMISGRHGELSKGSDGVKLRQLSKGCALDVGREGPGAAFMEQFCGVRAGEGTDHR
jgi:hypothetical protein